MIRKEFNFLRTDMQIQGEGYWNELIEFSLLLLLLLLRFLLQSKSLLNFTFVSGCVCVFWTYNGHVFLLLLNAKVQLITT